MSKNGKNLVIFGDSYSTFGGYIPEGMAIFYPNLDVLDVEDTWWRHYVRLTGDNVIHNNSWSGSTIGYTSYEGRDCSKDSSFIHRFRKILEEGFFENNKVDKIFVFGGTNDSWAEAPLGEPKFSGWTEKDLFCVLHAVGHMMFTLKKNFPDKEIVFIINTDIKPQIQDYMEEAAKKFGVKFVRLHDIDKESCHPTKLGMKQIAEQVYEVSK